MKLKITMNCITGKTVIEGEGFPQSTTTEPLCVSISKKIEKQLQGKEAEESDRQYKPEGICQPIDSEIYRQQELY